MLVYGRYVEVITPPLLAVGLLTGSPSPDRGSQPGEAITVSILAMTVVVTALRTGLDVPGGDGPRLRAPTRSARGSPIFRSPGFSSAEGVAAAAATFLAAVLVPRLRARPGVMAGGFARPLLWGARLCCSEWLSTCPKGGNRWHQLKPPARDAQLRALVAGGRGSRGGGLGQER